MLPAAGEVAGHADEVHALMRSRVRRGALEMDDARVSLSIDARHRPHQCRRRESRVLWGGQRRPGHEPKPAEQDN
jgi:hypothetical protein